MTILASSEIILSGKIRFHSSLESSPALSASSSDLRMVSRNATPFPAVPHPQSSDREILSFPSYSQELCTIGPAPPPNLADFTEQQQENPTLCQPSVAYNSQDTFEDSTIQQLSGLSLGGPLGLPESIFTHIVSHLDHSSMLNTRVTAKSCFAVCAKYRPLRFRPFYRLPVELIQLILGFTCPSSFNAARHICRAWSLSALEASLLRAQLRTLGFYNADVTVQHSQNTLYLSTRLSREFSLGADRLNAHGLRNTVIIDMSELAATDMIHFTVSICGSYALLSEGCVVYVYRLRAMAETCIEFVASVVCPRRVLAVSMDTSSRRFAIAILLVCYPFIEFVPTERFYSL